MLFVLEKYAINLLCDEKPQRWREIKTNASAIKDLFLHVHGALGVLRQMGYTQVDSIFAVFFTSTFCLLSCLKHC